MYCSKCGILINQGEKFCDKCGNQIIDNFNNTDINPTVQLFKGMANNESSIKPDNNLNQQYNYNQPQQVVNNYPQSSQQNFNQQTHNNNEVLTQNIEQSKKMTMGFAYFFIILLAFSTVSNCIALFDKFDIVTFAVTIFDATTIVFLIMRKKLGRLLAMINCVISAFFGIINIIVTINGLNASGNSSVNALGVVIALVIILGWNLLAFNYFRVRKCMYTK